MVISRIGRVKVLGFLAIVLLALSTLIQLNRMPPVWWDEGWTLTVARNWAVDGYYGLYLSGERDSTGLAAGFPVIAQVAGSFRLLGVGIWQGRLPGLFCLWGSFALLYFLAGRIYGKAIAWGAVAVTLLMSVGPWLHPLIVGRQVLGEAPAVFYLLAGYASLWGALRRRAWLIIPTVFFFAIAITAKAQVPPFWVASMLLPFIVAVFRRWWRVLIMLVIVIVVTHLTVEYGLVWIQNLLIAGHTVTAKKVTGLIEVTAVVLNWNIRLNALLTVLTFGLPTLLGLVITVFESFKNIFRSKQNPPPKLDPAVETIRLALLGFTSSWLAWFIFLGMSNVRYLFPVVFMGSIFTAALLDKLTMHFNLSKTVKHASALLLRRNIEKKSLGALLAVIMIATTVPFNLLTLDLMISYENYNPNIESALVQVDDYLNTHTPAQVLIETYDSEVFFLLNRRYHYPPDDMHVLYIQRTDLKHEVSIGYNPLTADPDYLVVGNFSHKWHVYDDVIASGAFRKIMEFPGYEIFERIR